MVKEKKKFIGKVQSEYLAARLYDKHALLNDGIIASTNFNYTRRQLEAFLRDLGEETEECFRKLELYP